MQNNLLIRLPQMQTQVQISKNWFTERDKLILESRSIDAIITKDDFSKGAEILSRITKTSSSLEKMRKTFARPFSDAAKLIKEAADSAREPLENEKASLKEKMAAYAQAQAEKYAEEEAGNAESVKDTISELKKLSEETFGPSETELFNAPGLFVNHETDKASDEKVSVRTRISFTIDNPGKVPLEFLSPDETKLRTWLNLNREYVRESLRGSKTDTLEIIPGVNFKIETEVSSR